MSQPLSFPRPRMRVEDAFVRSNPHELPKRVPGAALRAIPGSRGAGSRGAPSRGTPFRGAGSRSRAAGSPPYPRPYPRPDRRPDPCAAPRRPRGWLARTVASLRTRLGW